MRILALDVGDKTIGIAVCDELKLTAQGVEVIRRTSPTKDFTRLNELITMYQVGLVVIGLPKNMNGTIGPRGELVKEFASTLIQTIPNIEITFWDERLSTVAAQKSLIAADVSRAKRRQVIDKMAAVFILQGYLDSLARG
ncbi:Putative Holliday junction resolvase [Sporomusa ovata DSM 2662]|uniref:Putative pre-16S rRNA nuclease n=1 Tax=Sporomusa ovata TaxID=2378 RepID=A0A0U1L2V8_9FIRM|nr:Holliday junction resolvase RuvX [Sporomusa ovata]EQB25472.1 RNAse H-fold protein YqgF [Sporomusa ovata DSM 2662]CQR74037.1 Putative Holliday junction resolvase YqgF [Sporomusa ovata]